MSVNQTNCRADMTRVVRIRSQVVSRAQPCDEDTPFQPITPAQVDRMSPEAAYRQEVQWETYAGLHGPSCLLKEVERTTAECPECGTEGRYDYIGDIVCDDPACGVVISAKPQLLPEDGFNGRCNTDSGKPALNPARRDSSTEPDVQ